MLVLSRRRGKSNEDESANSLHDLDVAIQNNRVDLVSNSIHKWAIYLSLFIILFKWKSYIQGSASVSQSGEEFGSQQGVGITQGRPQ